ncbi:hypothetical protein [Marinobacter sp.]|uniref:hypothetical protein n=1 Tax=Marinobacter sp. TaxID=50741 RepID=UPI003A8F903B
MREFEPDIRITIQVMNWVSLVIASATGLYLILSGYNAALGAISISVTGALGFIGAYLGTWLLLIAAYLLFWVVSGIALGLIIVLSLFFVVTIFGSLLG